ncbi:MAG: amidohydrolase [Candidatus Rariloculaceae bacterium]
MAFQNNKIALLLGCWLSAVGLAQAQGPGDSNLMLVNGQIHTLEANNSVVSRVLIQNGRIVATGDDLEEPTGGVEVIDLQGRTAVPGLIDSHVHFIRAGLRPGFDTRGIESARSIAELQNAIAARAAEVPDDTFVTAVGGWSPVQFRENRFPTLAELDEVTPNQPVYVHLRANGPAITNSAGRSFFEQGGIDVGPDGMIPAGGMGAAPGNAVDAYDLLKATRSEEDKQRSTRDLMAYANSLGLTTVIDAAGTNRPGAQLLIPSEDYEPIMEVWRKKEMTVRVRPMFMSWDLEVGDGSGPSEVEERVRNSFMGHGDEWFKVAGLGEHTVNDSQSPAFYAATALAARERWLLQEHSGTTAENYYHIEAFEAANDISPIADLHWSLTHVHEIDAEIIERLQALGAGVTVQNQRFYSMDAERAGPPFRLIVRSGIPAGGGTDSTVGHPVNPWYSIYYMVTGKNVVGDPINAEHTITRMEALRLYTIGSAWFSHDEDELGSIEVGKFGDITVLSDDYFKVSEEGIQDISAELTIVGGNVVYAGADFQ